MKNNVIVLLMLFVQDLSYKKVLLAKLLNSDYVIVADDMWSNLSNVSEQIVEHLEGFQDVVLSEIY